MKLWCCYVPNLGSYSYVKLGDISEVITKGTTAKKFLNDGVAFIKIESINSRTTLGNKLSYISEEEHKTYLKRSILKEGDILFSIAGALGIVHIVQKEELPANTNQALSIIRLKQKEKIEYVSWFLETPSIKKMILELKSIGAQPNLSLEQISNIKIPMLSSNKLEHIVVELLNTIEKRIETQNKIIEEKKKLIKVINNVLFDSSMKEQHKLNNLLYQYGGLSGKSASDFGSGFPYITFLSVLNNYYVEIKQTGLVKVSDNERQNIVNYGDVILTLSSETPEEVGVAAVSKVNERVYLNSFCMGLRPLRHDLLEQEYIPWLFSTKAFRKHIYPYAQGSTRFNLNVSSFMNSSFFIPSKKEQICFSKLLNNLLLEVEIEEKIIGRYKEQKQYLLKNLFI